MQASVIANATSVTACTTATLPGYRLEAVHVERVSIRDALGGLAGLQRGGFNSLWKKVELIEPTFQVRTHSRLTLQHRLHSAVLAPMALLEGCREGGRECSMV